MLSKIVSFAFYIFLSLQLHHLEGQTWIKAGYYDCSDDGAIPISRINSSLFTHLLCGFASVNSTSYELSLSSSDENCFSTFTDNVKRKNPSLTTLLSIWVVETEYSTFSSMVSNSSSRKSFIDSSIKLSRLYGFEGIDFYWEEPKTNNDMSNMGILFREWRGSLRSEVRNSSQSELILTSSVNHVPWNPNNYPCELMQQYLNWVIIMAVDISNTPENSPKSTAGYAALYDPNHFYNVDIGIKEWINRGLSANKMVFMFAYYGYAWTLENPEDNGLGAPAKGAALSSDGLMYYKDIKNLIRQTSPGNQVMYNATYVVNYCIIGTIWIGFDDVDAITTKISYAKEKKLLGYVVYPVSYDDDYWTLSKAAAEVYVNDTSVQENNEEKGQNGKRPLLIIILSTTAPGVVLLVIFVICYRWKRKHKLKPKQSKEEVNKAAAAGDFNSNTSSLVEYTFADIEAATNGFSFENKLGEGGFGPVYKGILSEGQEIAVKKLSKHSNQGFEEFKNEVHLTAKLQHINLVRVLGFCIDREEQILIYEYMPNKSLDFYLFDPVRKYVLDWKKRVRIIEGITQGLLYLQEYSRFTIIHRDLKASNVLLDKDMEPKISDFGMARIFAKHDLEANTSRIVGTFGYISPEYIKEGIYSTKSDVYSFGVLLLQIISGKMISLLHGPNQNLSLLHYAYELWKDGKGIEFMDPALDDTYSSCKLTRCLQIALLCIQENPNDRPSMLEISSMLRNETTHMMFPKKPAFSEQNGHDGRKSMEGYSGSVLSTNDTTISEVIPR